MQSEISLAIRIKLVFSLIQRTQSSNSKLITFRRYFSVSEDFPVVFNPQQKFHQLQRVSEKFDEHARAPPVYGNTKDFYSNPLYCIDESARCENVSRSLVM